MTPLLVRERRAPYHCMMSAIHQCVRKIHRAHGTRIAWIHVKRLASLQYPDGEATTSPPTWLRHLIARSGDGWRRGTRSCRCEPRNPHATSDGQDDHDLHERKGREIRVEPRKKQRRQPPR